MHSGNSIHWIESRLTWLPIGFPLHNQTGNKYVFSSMISLSKVVSAIFNFEITWASNPISLANWLIGPNHKFTAHGEESAFRGQKYQTWLIFSSRTCMAKFSRKLRRTREETAEQTTLPGHLLSCFLSYVAGLSY